MHQANEIISGDSQRHLYKKGGDTGDIISAIMSADSVGTTQVRKFAKTIEGPTVPDTCYNLYKWVRDSIPFVEDPKGWQAIQLPGEVYNNRYNYIPDENGNPGTGKGADCKSMSLFCSSVLRCLDNFYEFQYRFISERADKPVHHVYLIVFFNDAQSNRSYVPLDCTLAEFGIETPFVKKTDMDPTIPLDSPRVGEFNLFKIGATTQNQYEQNFWEPIENNFRKSFGAEKDHVKANIMWSIHEKWLAHPIKHSEFAKALLKNWSSFLDFASVCIYNYWNERNFGFHIAQANNPNPTDVPFPPEYAEKKATGIAFMNALLTIGATPDDIRRLVALGVWKKYGCTLEYMLYRCYCIKLYGQPFRPQPGIPWWDGNIGGFNDNESGGLAFNLIVCIPAQGGVGRPFGEPYWSFGGHIMMNGSTYNDSEMKIWLHHNPKPGTPIGGDPQNLVGGVIVNNGDGVSVEFQQQSLIVYNRWMAGNMVMLPQPKPEGGLGQYTNVVPGGGLSQYANVGYVPIAETVSIIVAVVSAVATVAGVIIKLVEAFKHPADAKNIALPVQDFKWDYQTSDGCIIGHCGVATGCNGAQTVKMCNGKIVEINPDPLAPGNQAPDPGTLFTGPEGNKKKLLLVGGAVAVLGAGVLILND